jgi:hypothetical protein
MAAVEFPVEALGTAVGDGAWFWASGRSRFPAVSHLIPKIGAGERLPGHCPMVAISEDWRSSVSGQPGP